MVCKVWGCEAHERVLLVDTWPGSQEASITKRYGNTAEAREGFNLE